MSLCFDEELNTSGFHRPRRFGDEGREIEGLNVETFEVVEDGGTDVALPHSGLAADEHSRPEDTESFES